MRVRRDLGWTYGRTEDIWRREAPDAARAAHVIAASIMTPLGRSISRMPSMMAQTKTIASITASPSALSKGVGQDAVMQSGRAADALARKVDDPLRNDLSAVRIAFEYLEIGARQLECD